MRALAAVAGVVLLALGVGAGWLVGRETSEAETDTTTVTETSTETVVEGFLPEEVEETRAELLAAAEAGDYDALRPHLTPAFRYTFGGPVEGGPIAYWQELERTTDERPLVTLATILELPPVLSRGIYAWPWAYTVEGVSALSPHERELLEPLGPLDELFVPGTGYLGWRTGIEPDGTWAFFLAGD